MRPNHLYDILKVWLTSTDQSVACVQLWRRDGDFTARDQALLGVLHQDLIRLRALALAAAGTWNPAGVRLTPREAEILIWAIRGHSHPEIAARLVISPGTVGKHLEHAYEKLGVRSRAEAAARLLFPTAPD